MIEEWLQQRQHLIVLYCSICGVHQQINDSPTKIQRLKSFCQTLVDYASAGHFEVYKRLLHEAEQVNDATLEIAEKTLPKIQETTEVLLDFNDRYETEELTEEMQVTLAKHLSKLGEAMVARFDLEDELVGLAQSPRTAERA
ncbi:MAG: sigma D regulator [Pseudomonadales bacterium]